MVAQIDAAFAKARPWKLWPRLLAYVLFEGRPLTTRGRWINPLVFAGYRLWSALPLRGRELRPIFILGVGRSGTTILGTILALHRHVGYLNEPKALWHAALGDDDLIGSYSSRPGRYRMTRDDARAGPVRRLHRYYRAFLWLSGSRRVVDKYPELLFRTDLIDAAFPGAQKILLLRNGADTCQSIAAWSARRDGSGSDWWGRDRRKWHLLVEQLVAPDPFFAPALAQIRALTRHVDMAAVEWIVTMREAARLQAQAAAGLTVVRYEELVREPRRVLSEVLAFCDLPPDEVMLNYGERMLAPRAAHSCPDLDAAVAPLFGETMRASGYAPDEVE